MEERSVTEAQMPRPARVSHSFTLYGGNRCQTSSTAGVLVGQGAQGVVSLVAAPIIISNAGAESFGLSSAIITTEIAGAFADLGTANTVLTEVPKALARSDVPEARRTVAFALRVAGLPALGLGVATALVVYALDDSTVGNAFMRSIAWRQRPTSASPLPWSALRSPVGSVFFKLRQGQGLVGTAFLYQVGPPHSVG